MLGKINTTVKFKTDSAWGKAGIWQELLRQADSTPAFQYTRDLLQDPLMVNNQGYF